ncbi:MAG: hypothetical protein LBU85_07900 [Treponema sp.]|jgi:hypothetical protein|nr:hypothetical protein [Treponema sp.]
MKKILIVLFLALTLFNGCDNTTTGGGTKTPDITALDDKIAEAESAREEARIAADAGEVAPNEKWVTADEMSAFNAAIEAAKAARSASTQAEVDGACLALSAALNTFREAQKPGTGTIRRAVSINGLDALNLPDGTEITLVLFQTVEFITSGEDIVSLGSDDLVQDSPAVFDMYNPAGGALWTGSGSYYAVFMFVAEPPNMYISKEKIAFSDSAPTAAKTFSDFKPYVYRYTFGYLAWRSDIEIPDTGMTVDEWCLQIWGADYAELLAADDIAQICKDEDLTQPFSGSDTITADTMLYCMVDIRN